MLNTLEKETQLNRRAFTLIELVVVIALLALLSALLVMGIGKMQTNGKRQQTRLIMQNLSAMFADYDANRRVPFGAGDLGQTLISSAGLQAHLLMPCPQNVELEYNTAAEQGSMPTATSFPAAAADRKGLDGNYAVPITRSFIAQLMTTPNTAASIGKLSSSSLMTFAGFSPSSNTPAPVAWTATTYNVGDFVTDSSGLNYFIRTKVKTDASGILINDSSSDAPPNYYYWMPALPVPTPTVLPGAGTGTALPTPVLLDAWGNPIIFVIGGVLGSGANLVSNPANTGGPRIPGWGTGAMVIGSVGQTGTGSATVNSPDYHPFFASAGPDGDFSKGDDNLYSFEK